MASVCEPVARRTRASTLEKSIKNRKKPETSNRHVSVNALHNRMKSRSCKQNSNNEGHYSLRNRNSKEGRPRNGGSCSKDPKTRKRNRRVRDCANVLFMLLIGELHTHNKNKGVSMSPLPPNLEMKKCLQEFVKAEVRKQYRVHYRSKKKTSSYTEGADDGESDKEMDVEENDLIDKDIDCMDLDNDDEEEERFGKLIFEMIQGTERQFTTSTKKDIVLVSHGDDNKEDSECSYKLEEELALTIVESSEGLDDGIVVYTPDQPPQITCNDDDSPSNLVEENCCKQDSIVVYTPDQQTQITCNDDDSPSNLVEEQELGELNCSLNMQWSLDEIHTSSSPTKGICEDTHVNGSLELWLPSTALGDPQPCKDDNAISMQIDEALNYDPKPIRCIDLQTLMEN